jgi:hypothetical protein
MNAKPQGREGGGVSDERWRQAAIVSANRVAIFATVFATTRAERARLREALTLVFGALADGDSQ